MPMPTSCKYAVLFIESNVPGGTIMETIQKALHRLFAVHLVSLALILLFAAATSHAAPVAPDKLLQGVTTEVIASLKQDPAQAHDPAKLAALVETRVVPIFDFSRMTQLAMGKSWRLASAAQQEQLTGEFKALLIRTYSVALAQYRDQPITYKPLRLTRGDTDTTVRSEVKHGSRVFRIDYEMTSTPEGWKVYDVKLDAISLVTSFRGGFASKIRDAGVDGLIRALTEKNREDASPVRAARTASTL
jgi:phospholipid transport system substrate-binding protein